MSISIKDRVLSMTIAQLREHGLTQVTAIMLLKRLKPYPACLRYDMRKTKQRMKDVQCFMASTTVQAVVDTFNKTFTFSHYSSAYCPRNLAATLVKLGLTRRDWIYLPSTSLCELTKEEWLELPVLCLETLFGRVRNVLADHLAMDTPGYNEDIERPKDVTVEMLLSVDASVWWLEAFKGSVRKTQNRLRELGFMTSDGPFMTPTKKMETDEIALLLQEWHWKQLGTERFMGTLKAAAEDLGIADERMQGFCLHMSGRMLRAKRSS